MMWKIDRKHTGDFLGFQGPRYSAGPSMRLMFVLELEHACCPSCEGSEETARAAGLGHNLASGKGS
jgi:hypothetical protein